METHMAVGWLRADRDVSPWADRSFVDTSRLRREHDALAAEMVRRGMNHGSPLPDFPDPGLGTLPGEEENLRELADRCPDCGDRIRRRSAGGEGARDGSERPSNPSP